MQDSSAIRSTTAKGSRGFNLIELMVVLAIITIRAAIAVPSYSSYITQSRAKGASSDLVALALVYEADFQTALAYPIYAAGTVIPAVPSNRTGTQATYFPSWSPAEGSYYTYTLNSSASAYTLTATANTGTCVLTLSNLGTRTAAGNCGFTSW